MFLNLSLISSNQFLGSANGTKITKNYYFDDITISKTYIENRTYHKIHLINAFPNGNPGEPALPAYPVSLLLPPFTRIKNIEIKTGDKIFLGDNFCINPILPPKILSSENKDLDFTSIMNTKIYSSDSSIPQSLFTLLGIQKFRGYSILQLQLHPFKYTPNNGELFYYESLTVSVDVQSIFNEKLKVNSLLRDVKRDINRIGNFIDNPQMLSQYESILSNTPQIIQKNEYDFLILTTESLKNSFIPLKENHLKLITKIKTINEISNSSGNINPELIRNFIRQEYINYGIEYVLIAGDYEVIPAKKLWVEAWSGGPTEEIPSDLYYSCLDGTYNYDGDSKWGEPHDGENGGEVDLMAEVYVGRACVDNIEEANNFVEKTITYMNSNYLLNKTLLVGEYLWENPDTFGGDYMDELVDKCNSNFYKTNGIPSSRYYIETIYDRDWPDFDPNDTGSTEWKTSDLVDILNKNNIGFVNHLGHSSTQYNMRISASEVSFLNNSNPFFLYSQGCSAGSFDKGDSMAEYFTVENKFAAYAAILNARSGWGVSGSTNGANQRYHREFYDAIFDENITAIGMANQDSKEDLSHRINQVCMRWCYYQLNLFGDPTLEFFYLQNSPPQKPEKPKLSRFSRELNTVSLDDDGDDLYYQWYLGKDTFSDWIGPFESEEIAVFNFNWTTFGFHQVKVRVRDQHRFGSEWSDSITIFSIPIINKFFELGLFWNILEKLLELIS